MLELPECWHSELSGGIDNCPPTNFIWWESLNDPLLCSLIERAKVQNLDLFIAAMRILQAREELKGGKASYLPRVDVTTSFDYVHFNQGTLNRILDLHQHGHQRNIGLFEAGFDVEWEIDLFGVTANKVKALYYQAEGSEEDFRQIEITLLAEVARNYIEIRGTELRLEILDKQIEMQKEDFSLQKGLSDTGFIAHIEQKQIEEQLKLLQAQKPDLKLAIEKAIHRLSILLGYCPHALYEELSCPSPLPLLPFQKPIGIPSEILRSRPDIRRAERNLASANALIDSAAAELFPRLTLRGFIGDLSAIGSNGLAIFAGPQLLYPLFNSKMIKQGIEINKYKAKQACYEYQKTVLTALEETENAISEYHSELEKQQYLCEALKASQEASQLTSQLYQIGFKNYSDVLERDRHVLNAKIEYTQSQVALLLRYIALYKALGGEWCQ